MVGEGIAAGGACKWRILPGSDGGVERRGSACSSAGRQMDLCSSTSSPSQIYTPLAIMDLESIFTSVCAET